MKQNLLKLSMLLLCMVMGLSCAWATTVTFTFKTDTDITYTASGTSGTGSACEIKKGNVVLTSTKGYCASTKTFSSYGNSEMTVTAPGNISSITISYNGKVYPFDEAVGDGSKGEKFTASGAHAATYTPAEKTKSITFTNPNGGKTELLSVVVVYEGADDVAVTGVSLDKATAAIVIGETTQLTATVAPSDATDKAVTWSTSDKTIATVTNMGVVKGIGAGTATITVTTKDGSKTATCKVTVSAVSATGITLDKTSIEVMAGLSEKLTATIAPENASNKKVTWTSSDEAVATVDADGYVAGVAAGTATITAKTVDGGFTATCNVTVKKYEKPTKIEILFAPSSSDSDSSSAWTKTSATNSVFSSGHDYVYEITATDKVYPARNSLVNGAKFGTSSAAGTISFSLKEAMNVYKIIVSAAPYGDSEGFEGFTINGKSVSMTDGINKKYADYVVELDGSAISSIAIKQNNASNGRIFVKGVTLMLEDKDFVAYSAKTRKLTAKDGDDYYATFSSTSPVFFPETVTVSTVNIEGGAMSVNALATTTVSIDGEEVKGRYVPANTGVLISSASEKANYYSVYGYTPAAMTGNMLRPATAEMTGDYKFYKLAYDDITNKTNLGFYYGAEDGASYTCKDGLAYLAVPKSSAAKSFTFNQATSIIKPAANKESKIVYNLNGQRLSGLQKGINIVDGKKLFVK